MKNKKAKKNLTEEKIQKKEIIACEEEKILDEEEKKENQDKKKIIALTKRKQILSKIKELGNKFFNSIGFTILIFALIVLKALLFYKNTIMIREEINESTILGTITFVFVLMSIVCILPSKPRTITVIVLDVLISIILFGDDIYYTYSNNVLSVLQITNLQYGEEILSTIPVLLNISHLLYFIDIIIIFGLIWAKKIKIQESKKSSKLIMISKICVFLIGIYMFSTIGKEYINYISENPYDKDIQIKRGSIFGFHIADVLNSFDMKKQAKYETKDEMMEDYLNLKEEYEQYEEPIYNFEKMCEGKNLIILQLESIQDFVINKKINGTEITPNLNKFLNENVRFLNMYMQSYSSTADSEFSSITSLYPMENGMSYSKYNSNTYDDIFTSFKQANYTTSYIHGNFGFFWNRENVYKNFSVDKIEFKDSFEDTSENIMGYLSDELLYKQSVEKLKNYEEPFMSYIVSASSHTGFTLDGLQDETKVNINIGEYEGTFFGNYLRSVNYADYAFGIFIDELKKNNLYDDTVILIYGDHNGLEMYNEEMLDFFAKLDQNLNDAEIKLNYIRVAAGMKLPGIEKLKIEKPVSKLDIKPTICYLFNLDPGFSLGTNMFARKDFISLNNKRMVTSRYYFDEKWYNIENGEELVNIDDETKKLLEKYFNQMETELEISKSVTINNLLN